MPRPLPRSTEVPLPRDNPVLLPTAFMATLLDTVFIPRGLPSLFTFEFHTRCKNEMYKYFQLKTEEKREYLLLFNRPGKIINYILFVRNGLPKFQQLEVSLMSINTYVSFGQSRDMAQLVNGQGVFGFGPPYNPILHRLFLALRAHFFQPDCSFGWQDSHVTVGFSVGLPACRMDCLSTLLAKLDLGPTARQISILAVERNSTVYSRIVSVSQY